MRATGSVPARHFEDLYAASADPWAYETSAYEHAKYDATVAALAGRRYARGLEIGCSIGVLTRRLAMACESLLAVDASRLALDRARARCCDLPNVVFRRLRLPAEPAPGRFDLVVCSEVAYYWDEPDLERAGRWMLLALEPGGLLLLVHWTHPVAEHPQTGDAVHDALEALARDAGCTRAASCRTADYRLDAWRMPG